MLSSYFVFNGLKQITNPAPLVDAAEPIADRVVPLAKKVAPAQVAGFIPNDAKTLVRLNGALMAVGGLGLGSGLGRRCGAGLVAAGMLPHAIASRPGTGRTGLEKDAQRAVFVRNLALLGGAMIASQDTQGKPSLGWRAADAKARLARSTDKKAKALGSDVEHLSRKARKQLAKAQKDAEKQARKLQKQAGRKADEVGGAIADLLP